MIKDSDDEEDFKSFLSEYPKIKLAGVARIKLKKIQRAKVKKSRKESDRSKRVCTGQSFDCYMTFSIQPWESYQDVLERYEIMHDCNNSLEHPPSDSKWFEDARKKLKLEERKKMNWMEKLLD